MAKTSNFALSFNMFCDMIDQIITDTHPKTKEQLNSKAK